MRTSRIARSYGVSALLGLPAALLAHTLVFGQAHAIAGSFHVAALAAGAASLAVAALLGAFAAVRREKSVAPHMLGMALSATAWLAALEAGESRHAIPTLFCLLAVAAAVWIVALLSQAYTQTVSTIATLFLARDITHSSAFIARFDGGRVPRNHTFSCFTLFSRPPPALS